MTRSRLLHTATAAMAALVMASAAYADWDLGEPYKMHWPQTPDPVGYDVLDGMYVWPTGEVGVKILADDWKCTQTGPVTDIHVWSSYNNDYRGDVPPNLMFNLAIYSDIPAIPGVSDYSRPGDLLWQAYVKPTAERVWSDNFDEQFYDPNRQEMIGSDNVCWQYNFLFDRDKAFHQEEGTIYWLSVSHTPDLTGDNMVFLNDFLLPMGGWAYGWKTTNRPWNDSAVWVDVDWPIVQPADVVAPSGTLWNELRLPSGAPLDLAFVITPEPATLALLGLGVAGLVARRRRR